jgi:hypothetical protein
MWMRCSSKNHLFKLCHTPRSVASRGLHGTELGSPRQPIGRRDV